MEELEAMGQSSDLKASRWVKEYYENQSKKDWDKKVYDLEILEKLRKFPNRQDYLRYLSDIFLSFAKDEDIPKKYAVEMTITDIGIVVKIKKRGVPDGTPSRSGAFKAVGIPFYDRHACKIMAVRLGNTVAKLEGYRPKSDGGIILIDKEDQKIYGSKN